MGVLTTVLTATIIFLAGQVMDNKDRNTSQQVLIDRLLFDAQGFGKFISEVTELKVEMRFLNGQVTEIKDLISQRYGYERQFKRPNLNPDH